MGIDHLHIDLNVQSFSFLRANPLTVDSGYIGAFYDSTFPSKALRTFSGVIGISVNRIPIAS